MYTSRCNLSQPALFISLYLTHKYKPSNRRQTQELVNDLLRCIPGLVGQRVRILIVGKETDAMPSFSNHKFAAIELREEHVANLEVFANANEVTFTTASEHFLENGYKISVRWVVDQNAFCYSVTGTDETRHNKGMTLTSWSDDLDEVATIAMFKHVILCTEGQWPERNTGQRWG